MSLRNRLVMFIGCLLLVVLVGTFMINVSTTRDHVVEQMRLHAQDTATSLGLSLVPPLADGDLTLAETMLAAIFDSGYYSRITLENAEGEVLVDKHVQTVRTGVPGWFEALAPVSVPDASSEVMVGWSLAGTVTVSSHPREAYRQIWQVTVRTTALFALVFLLAALVALAAVRYMLRPLREVESQALAVMENRFPVLERVPRAEELRRVVTAMNKMTRRIESTLAEQMRLAEDLRQQANQDPLTGLANRRHFTARAEHLLRHRDEHPQVTLMLLELHGLAELNDSRGYEAGDRLLEGVTDVLCRYAPPSSLVARVGGADFAVLTTALPAADAPVVARELMAALSDLERAGLAPGPDVGTLGIACAGPESSLHDLLAVADTALAEARRRGANGFRLEAAGGPGHPERGAHEWLDAVRLAMEHEQIALDAQDMFDRDSRVFGVEMLARLEEEDGRVLPAAAFVPTLELHGLAPEFDRVVLRETLEAASRSPGDGPFYAVNISATSLRDPRFLEWLAEVRPARTGSRVVLEAPEHNVLTDIDWARRFIDRARELGFGVAIDGFGVNFSSLGYLRDLPLDYIKIDGSYTREIDTNADNQFFLRVVAEVAHGVGIRVLAEYVETETEWRTVRELGADGGQGFYLGVPRRRPREEPQ